MKTIRKEKLEELIRIACSCAAGVGSLAGLLPPPAAEAEFDRALDALISCAIAQLENTDKAEEKKPEVKVKEKKSEEEDSCW